LKTSFGQIRDQVGAEVGQRELPLRADDAGGPVAAHGHHAPLLIDLAVAHPVRAELGPQKAFDGRHDLLRRRQVADAVSQSQQEPLTLLLRRQRIKRLAGLGDVERHADVAHEGPVRTEPGLHPHPHPAPAAIRARKPRLEAVGQAVGTGGLHGGGDLGLIIGMQGLAPDVAENGLSRLTEEFHEGGVHELHLGLGIRHPDRRGRGVGHQAEAGLAFAQGGFSSLGGGDVDSHRNMADQTTVCTGKGAKARLRPDDRAVWPYVPLLDLALMAFERLLQDIMGRRDVVGVGDIARRDADHLVRGAAQQFGEAGVGADDPPVQIHPRDAGRGLIHHGAEFGGGFTHAGVGLTQTGDRVLQIAQGAAKGRRQNGAEQGGKAEAQDRNRQHPHVLRPALRQQREADRANRADAHGDIARDLTGPERRDKDRRKQERQAGQPAEYARQGQARRKAQDAAKQPGRGRLPGLARLRQRY
jgi:hypothetical protein